MSSTDQKEYVGDNRKFTAEPVNATVITARDLIAVCHGSHATTTSAGRAKRFATSATIHEIVTGLAERGITGDTSVSVPLAIGSTRNAGDYAVEFAVTGAAGTRKDIGKIVYATAHGTLTLTHAVRGVPVGWVSGFVSNGRAKVAFWDGPMLVQYANRQDCFRFLVPLLGTDTSKTFGQVYVDKHCEIYKVEGTTITAAAGTGANSTLTLRRDPLDAGSGQTSLTGGVLTLSTAACTEAALIAGTAVTANNELHEGDRLEAVLAITATGTFSAGLVEVRAYYRNLLGT